MKNNMEEVVIISGPTAAGKTAMAVEIAQKIGAEIISCDSVQVYRGMDIGSAKASPAERAGIPHHLIDVADPSHRFSVGEYVELAKAALEGILSRGRRAVVAGGSGFYLKSWFSAVTDEIEIPDSVRLECDAIERSGGPEALLKRLLAHDPGAGAHLDIKNPRRIRPALERTLASGLSLAELSERFSALPCPMGEFPKKFIMADLPDEILLPRAKARAENMVASGLVDEVRSLMKAGIEENPSAALAVGYRETISAIKSGDFSHLADDIFASTSKLIKKQRKFFKNALFKGVRQT